MCSHLQPPPSPSPASLAIKEVVMDSLALPMTLHPIVLVVCMWLIILILECKSSRWLSEAVWEGRQ